MKKIIFIMIALFTFSAFAKDQRTQLRPQSIEDIEASAKEVRSHEKEIRELYMQLVLRKAQMDIVKVLTQSHMAEEEIQKVMESNELQTYLSNLRKNPNIQALVEKHVQKIVQPGAIEAHVLKRRTQLAKETEENLIMARSDLRKSKVFRTKEEVFEPEDSQPLLSKVWNHLVDDLYKN